MVKIQNFIDNLGIILQKTRLMDKYIHGFQIRKVFPFHLILGAPDWEFYAETLNDCLLDLEAQMTYLSNTLNQRKVLSSEDISFLKYAKTVVSQLKLSIQKLIESNELHKNRFFNSADVSIKEISHGIKAFHESQNDYYSLIPEFKTKFNQISKPNE